MYVADKQRVPGGREECIGGDGPAERVPVRVRRTHSAAALVHLLQ